ncbi:MAG: flagellar hook-length control protein FliK [SAR324 cluster bacterium]|nr:flagellar hook-length control protein FliK [SAR324 cluster bacterium]
MEPIGQKTALSSSEEAVVTTELDVESGENEKEKIFDSTLDQMLAEETDYENMLEELLEEDGQDSLITYVHQNQFDSEIGAEKTADTLSDHTLFPSETIKGDLLSEDSRLVQSNILQKSVPIAEEMIELADPRIFTEDSNFVNLEESGVAETGLQSLLDETTPDSSTAVLQKVLHQVEHTSDEAELSEDRLQTVLRQNSSKVFNSEEAVEIPRSSLHTIMHKTSNQTVLPEEAVGQSGIEIKSEMKNNSGKQIQNHEDIAAANNKTAGETQTFNHKNEIPPVSSYLLSENSQDAEISISGDPAKNMLAGSTMSKEQLKASESLQVVENIKTHEGSQTKASINDVEEFAAEAKSRVSGGLQISEKDKAASESQSLIRPKASEVSKLTERFKGTEDLQGSTKGKVSEDLLAKEMFKSPDELKGTVKAKEIFQTTGSDTTKVSSEKWSMAPINQFRALASKETKFSGNENSGIEPVMSTGLSASSETSGTSIYKTPDSMNAPADNLRNVDLPFDIQQLVSRVRIMRGNGVEEMTLRLHPEELGHITLKVRQSGGDLLIEMRVDNPLAKQLVESGFDSLRSRFLDQEFAYKDLALNVDINQKDSQFGSDRQYEEFEDEMFSSQRGKEQEISTLEETPHVRHRTDSGLNLYV